MRITRSQERKLEKIGKKYKLKLILLHGSYAKGEAVRGRSDLDVAALAKGDIELDEYLRLHMDLVGVFGNLPERELDFKTLNKKDPLFLHEVVSNSQLLYGDVTDYDEFCAYVFKYYQDANDLFNLENLLLEKKRDRLMHEHA